MLSTPSAKLRASASEATRVQLVMTSCAPVPDQRSSDNRLALAGPPIRPAIISGSRKAAAMPPAIRPNSSYETLAEPSTARTSARSTAFMGLLPTRQLHVVSARSFGSVGGAHPQSTLLLSLCQLRQSIRPRAKRRPRDAGEPRRQDHAGASANTHAFERPARAGPDIGPRRTHLRPASR